MSRWTVPSWNPALKRCSVSGDATPLLAAAARHTRLIKGVGLWSINIDFKGTGLSKLQNFSTLSFVEESEDLGSVIQVTSEVFFTVGTLLTSHVPWGWREITLHTNYVISFQPKNSNVNARLLQISRRGLPARSLCEQDERDCGAAVSVYSLPDAALCRRRENFSMQQYSGNKKVIEDFALSPW